MNGDGPMNIFGNRACLAVRFKAKNGDHAEAGTIWANRFLFLVFADQTAEKHTHDSRRPFPPPAPHHPPPLTGRLSTQSSAPTVSPAPPEKLDYIQFKSREWPYALVYQCKRDLKPCKIGASMYCRLHWKDLHMMKFHINQHHGFGPNPNDWVHFHYSQHIFVFDCVVKTLNMQCCIWSKPFVVPIAAIKYQKLKKKKLSLAHSQQAPLLLIPWTVK